MQICHTGRRRLKGAWGVCTWKKRGDEGGGVFHNIVWQTWKRWSDPSEVRSEAVSKHDWYPSWKEAPSSSEHVRLIWCFQPKYFTAHCSSFQGLEAQNTFSTGSRTGYGGIKQQLIWGSAWLLLIFSQFSCLVTQYTLKRRTGRIRWEVGHSPNLIRPPQFLGPSSQVRLVFPLTIRKPFKGLSLATSNEGRGVSVESCKSLPKIICHHVELKFWKYHFVTQQQFPSLSYKISTEPEINVTLWLGGGLY